MTTPATSLRNSALAALLGWLAMQPALIAADAPGVVPGQLRCEYLTNPLGLDEQQPRLQWTLAAPEAARGVKQTAYQVLVASTAKQLAADQGDLWDSGKVASDETAHVVYAGKPLESRLRCYWKVRVWTGAQPSPWSQPASWEVGLRQPKDWTAKWINAHGYQHVTKIGNSKPVALKIIKAVYGSAAGAKDVTAMVASKVAAGGLSVSINNEVMGGDPSPQKIKTLTLDYELDGKRTTATVNENTTLSIPESYKPTTSYDDAAPYLRKAFKTADQKITKARLYVTALGLYEMHLNGQRVGDIFFAPEWTDYRKRVHYNAYDVTALLKPGANVLGGLVGHGWYSGHVGMGAFRFYGKVPALLAQLEISYADGTSQTIITDDSWKAAGSPVLSSDIMNGEDYDARLEVAGWDQPGLDDSTWAPVTLRSDPVPPLEGLVIDPVRVVKELPVQNLTEPQPGRWTFDLGQNMVGNIRLKVSAAAGTKLTLRYGEMINPDGTLYTTNLRGAKAIDSYVCKGQGVEIYHPRFTFHGFRYVEVTGLKNKPAKDLVTGLVVASDLPRTANFSCSDPRINQLYSNITWGQRGNFLSIPTDCPQRDERCGWAGDAQVFVRTAAYNADVAAFYRKWLVDMGDAQTADGAFTDVSPRVGFNHGTPGWADAGVICPWTIYQAYGDLRILEENYPRMVKWIEWCRANSSGLIRDKNRGGDYGDWLSINANTPKDLIGTAYFAYSTRLLAKAAGVLGKQEDAAKYEQLFQEIKAAFNRKFVAADGRIAGNTQSCYLMALKFELLSDELRVKAAQYLEDDIKAKGMHLSTGFIGVSYLLPVLTKAGRAETAYALFLQDTFPSWLFSVKHGATTIWERWDGWTPDKGFQDPGMNSFNHFSLGSCGEWMFSSLAGIDTDGPGFKKLMIRPTPGKGITAATASYDSVHGRIQSSWKTAGNQFNFELTVPANTTATVFVPAADPATVSEAGKPAAKAAGVQFLRAQDGAAVFAVGSGTYHFQSSLPPAAK